MLHGDREQPEPQSHAGLGDTDAVGQVSLVALQVKVDPLDHCVKWGIPTVFCSNLYFLIQAVFVKLSD